MLPEIGNKMRLLLGLAKVRSEVKIYLNIHSEVLQAAVLVQHWERDLVKRRERERERDLVKERERDLMKGRERETL